MHLDRRSLLLAMLLLIPAVAQAEDPPAPGAAEKVPGQRVFVTGHSFHAWIGTPLEMAAKSAGITDHKNMGAQSLGGSRVIQHWNLPDDKNKAKQALRSGEIDVLTVSPHAMLPDDGIDKFTDLLLEFNPQGRVYVQASWQAFDFGMQNALTFKNSDRDTVKVADVREKYQTFYSALLKQVNATNSRLQEQTHRQVVFVVPVGHAVYLLRERIAAGKVPGITKQSELFTDAIGHPTVPIATLASYCYYAAIYQRSPVGLPMSKPLANAKNPAWDEQFNTLLQELAWEAVSSEPLSGVKPAPAKSK